MALQLMNDDEYRLFNESQSNLKMNGSPILQSLVLALAAVSQSNLKMNGSPISSSNHLGYLNWSQSNLKMNGSPILGCRFNEISSCRSPI